MLIHHNIRDDHMDNVLLAREQPVTGEKFYECFFFGFYIVVNSYQEWASNTMQGTRSEKHWRHPWPLPTISMTYMRISDSILLLLWGSAIADPNKTRIPSIQNKDILHKSKQPLYMSSKSRNAMFFILAHRRSAFQILGDYGIMSSALLDSTMQNRLPTTVTLTVFEHIKAHAQNGPPNVHDFRVPSVGDGLFSEEYSPLMDRSWYRY